MQITRTNIAKPEWTYNLVGLTRAELYMIRNGLEARFFHTANELIRDINKALDAKSSDNLLGDAHAGRKGAQP